MAVLLSFKASSLASILNDSWPPNLNCWVANVIDLTRKWDASIAYVSVFIRNRPSNLADISNHLDLASKRLLDSKLVNLFCWGHTRLISAQKVLQLGYRSVHQIKKHVDVRLVLVQLRWQLWNMELVSVSHERLAVGKVKHRVLFRLVLRIEIDRSDLALITQMLVLLTHAEEVRPD